VRAARWTPRKNAIFDHQIFGFGFRRLMTKRKVKGSSLLRSALRSDYASCQGRHLTVKLGQ